MNPWALHLADFRETLETPRMLASVPCAPGEHVLKLCALCGAAPEGRGGRQLCACPNPRGSVCPSMRVAGCVQRLVWAGGAAWVIAGLGRRRDLAALFFCFISKP